MRRRLHAAGLAGAGSELTLDEESRRHAQVLRLAEGDALRLFDGEGHEADAVVARCDRRAVVCQVDAVQRMAAPLQRVHLAVCLPKAAKLETIVRMTTELGVSSITLVQSERAVPKWGADDPKLERLRRIAIEACAQAEQAYAPRLTAPLPLSAALDAAPGGALRCALLERSHTALPSVLPGHVHEVWALVGPEGGFAPEEVTLLGERGVLAVSLGPSVLRVETACVVACALLFDRLRTVAPSASAL